MQKQSAGVCQRQRDEERGYSGWAESADPRMGTCITYTTEILAKLHEEQNHSDNRICGPIISEGTGIKAAIQGKKHE